MNETLLRFFEAKVILYKPLSLIPYPLSLNSDLRAAKLLANQNETLRPAGAGRRVTLMIDQNLITLRS